MEGSCEYIEYALADSRRGAVRHLAHWAEANKHSPYDTEISTCITNTAAWGWVGHVARMGKMQNA
jgi:hypothetical protein